MERIRPDPVDALTVTTLVDNVSDILLTDDGPAKRAPFELATTGNVLRAEHGFSCLVSLTKGRRTTRVLFDTGITPDGMIENMRRLEIGPGDIDLVVLSHGHWDHTTGMHGLARALGRAELPVIIHPEFWSRRRIAIEGREPLELPSTSRGALEGAGFEIVEGEQPSFLLDGSLLVTGEIDRTTSFERGASPAHQAARSGGWEPDPLILDDQAIVARVRGRGLVVLTGCGHSGLINTLRHVRSLTGNDHVHAVIGGFHLSGRYFESIIGPTCDALVDMAPDYVVPTHCTGWRAIHEIAARMPQSFIPNSVGTRLEFVA